MTRWYDTDEVAAMIGVTRRTIQRWARDGKIGHIRIGETGPIRFTEEQLREAESVYAREPQRETPVPDPLNPRYRRNLTVVPIRRPAA